MTIAVVLGQIYVGLGYRLMAESIFNLTDKFKFSHVNSYTNNATR